MTERTQQTRKWILTNNRWENAKKFWAAQSPKRVRFESKEKGKRLHRCPQGTGKYFGCHYWWLWEYSCEALLWVSLLIWRSSFLYLVLWTVRGLHEEKEEEENECEDVDNGISGSQSQKLRLWVCCCFLWRWGDKYRNDGGRLDNAIVKYDTHIPEFMWFTML